MDDEPTLDLAKVRERLWEAFKAYSSPLSATTASAGEEGALKKRLRAPLKGLSPDDALTILFSYCRDARTLKHYLPRFLELAAIPGGQGPRFPDIAAALERHDFASWPVEERQAVQMFLATHGLRSQRG